MSEYERLVDTTRMRVERATRMQDAGPVLEDAVVVEARDLALLISDDPGDLQARRLLGWLWVPTTLSLPLTWCLLLVDW